jgi:ABC-type uncharacterized transport system permease subunit
MYLKSIIVLCFSVGFFISGILFSLSGLFLSGFLATPMFSDEPISFDMTFLAISYLYDEITRTDLYVLAIFSISALLMIYFFFKIIQIFNKFINLMIKPKGSSSIKIPEK